MLFGAHLVADADPAATAYGLPVPQSPAPTPFTQFLRSSRFPSKALVPAPAPAKLFPVVRMPRVTDTSNLEFSLEKTLEGIYARERSEQLQLSTLQTKLKLTDVQVREMDLLCVIRKEMARVRKETGEPDELPNPIVDKLRKTLSELPPLPAKRRKKKPKQPAKKKRPVMTEVELLRREMALSRAKHQRLEKEMQLSASKAMGVTGPSVFHGGRFSHAEAYVQAAGFDTLVKTVTRLLNAQLGAGWTKWGDFVKYSRYEEQQRKFLIRHAAAEVWNGIQATFNKLIGMRWDKWTDYVHRERLQENRAASDLNATIVGRYVRGHMCRIRVQRLIERRVEERRFDAAVCIQSRSRKTQASQRVARLRRRRVRYIAATMIQAMGRALFARHRVAYERELAKNVKSAVMLQNAWRSGRAVRTVRKVLRMNRREKGALRIQTRQRMRVAKRDVALMMIQRDQRRSSTRIQALARAVAARILADRLYEAREKEETDRYDAATYLAGCWRAREARVLFGSKLKKLMVQRRLEARSQAEISRFVRGASGRVKFKAEKFKYHKVACASAKTHEELWDDQGAAFYYYDKKLNQSFHEPPNSGYLRRDGLLVLGNGTVSEDPDNVLNDQQAAANAAADAARLLFGLYAEKAQEPMNNFLAFTQQRLALEGAASDVRMVQDERFNETCSTLEMLSNELYYAGRLGRPGAKPPVRVEQEAIQAEIEKRVQEAVLEQGSAYTSAGTTLQEPSAAYTANSTTTGTLHRKSQISTMGWQQLYDDQGNLYYYDEATGASQYENPYEGMERPSEATQQRPMTGKSTQSVESTYSQRAAGLNRPMTRGTEASANSILPSEEWQQHQDEQGAFYWYNAGTQVSQYEDPYDPAAYQLGSPADATYDTGGNTYDTYDTSSQPVYALEGAVETPWSQHQDEQGHLYWYNAETHDSTYDDPHPQA